MSTRTRTDCGEPHLGKYYAAGTIDEQIRRAREKLDLGLFGDVSDLSEALPHKLVISFNQRKRNMINVRCQCMSISAHPRYFHYDVLAVVPNDTAQVMQVYRDHVALHR